MNRFDLMVRIAATVLIPGLISCSKEQKLNRDSYKAEPPVIVQTEGNANLQEWNLLHEKSLDLQDSFDVTASQPARMEITTSCRQGSQHFTKSFASAPVQPVRIFQLLPPEVLVREVGDLDCSFELTLFNSLGSRHIFPVNTVRIEEKQKSPVTFQLPGEDQTLKRFTPANFADIKIRYRNAQSAVAELMCEEFSAPGLRFDQVKEFNHFDLSEPQQNPLQTCRVMIYANGILEQMSRLIEVQLPLPPLQISVQPQGYTQFQNSAEFRQWVNGIGFVSRSPSPGRHPMGAMTILNTATVPRVIRLAKRPLVVEIRTHLETVEPHSRPSKEASSSLSPAWLEPGAPLPSGGIVTDEGEYWRVELEANANLVISFEYAPKPMICLGYNLIGLVITATDHLKVEELSHEGISIEEIKVHLPFRLYWSIRNETTFEGLPRIGPQCAF